MKTYVKPDLYYENFELSQHVATCYYDMPMHSKPDTCWATDPIFNEHVFLASDICSSIMEEYCYTNGSMDNNIFNS